MCMHVHMQPSVIYVQCSELYASCVIAFQILCISQVQWSQTQQLYHQAIKFL
jgi:hypothetical protein